MAASATGDAPSTAVANGTVAKVPAWYHNELDYATRAVGVADSMAAREG